MVGHSPVFQILLQIEVRMSIMASPPAWTNSAGRLSTPADFLIFSALTAASTSFRRIEWCSSSGIYWVPISLIIVKGWAILCPSVKDFIFLCETLPRLVLYGCRFTLYPVSLLSGPWLAGMLSCWYSFWGMLQLPGTDPVSKSLLPSSSLSWSFF